MKKFGFYLFIIACICFLLAIIGVIVYGCIEFLGPIISYDIDIREVFVWFKVRVYGLFICSVIAFVLSLIFDKK